MNSYDDVKRYVIVMFVTCMACVPLAALAAGAGASSQERFLDNLPLLGQLVAAARAPVTAWSIKSRGRYALWVASGAPLKSRELYAYSDDDGIPVSELTLSGDGQWLAYVRGSTPNRQGEINNPLDRPDPQERALWVIRTTGGEPRRVIGGTTPAIRALAISPNDATLAFARGKEVWFAQLGGTAIPERAFTIRGNAGDLAWSPDGARLAFVSQRKTHSFVGVFDVGGRSIRYLSPGIDWDTRPTWSADGSKLAFIRNGEEVQSYRFTPRAQSNPWSILVASFGTGEVRTLWTADRGAGSTLAPLYDGRVLLWAGSSHLLFPWEKSGWRQVYSVDVKGGTAQKVTAGEGEVACATMSEDGATLYYTSNSLKRERFDLWETAVSGGAPRKLRAGDGGVPHDFAPVALGDGSLVFVGENTDGPRGVYVRSGTSDARLISAAKAVEFPTADLTLPQVIDLTADDGFVSHALLYTPRNVVPGTRRAALVYVHGGPTDISSLGVTKYDAKWAQSAVLRGYSVLMVNYRGGIGYGLAFREAPGQGGDGATDLRDVAAAGHYLASLPDVDAARIGIVGQSYGGYLVTAALARLPELWAAGVSVVGVADWQMEMELDAGGPLPLRSSERMRYEDRAYESSANAHLERWRAPILFISADDDQEGWLDQAIQLGQSLRKRGITVEALVEPGGVHGGATHGQLVTRLRTALDFFDRELGRTGK